MNDTQAEETMTRWLRPVEWQERTSMSQGQTYRALWSGELQAVRVGRAWYINANELDEYFSRNGKKAA